MQVRDKYQEFFFRINLTICIEQILSRKLRTHLYLVSSKNSSFNSYYSLSLSFFNKINIFEYTHVGPVVILWGPFGHTTTVTLPTHRTHLSLTRNVISLFNRFVTFNPKGRSFNVNLLFVAKIFDIFFTSLTIPFCIQQNLKVRTFYSEKGKKPHYT